MPEEDLGEPEPPQGTEPKKGKPAPYLPFEQTPEEIITRDAELAQALLKVKSRTAVDKVIEEKLDGETGKALGYEIKEAPNLFFEIISEDVTKANLSPTEKGVVLGLGTLSNFTQALSKELNVNLTPTQKFLADNYVLFCAVSRGKSGWNAWLSKTDKTISQTSVEQLSKQLQEEKKSRWKFW